MGGGRIAVQLDAIASQVFDSDDGRTGSEEGLGFLRIVSTAAVLQGMLNDDEPLSVGDWVEIEISPDKAVPGPWAWSLQLRENRFIGDERTGRPARGKVVAIRRLARASQPIDPKPLGASLPAARVRGSSLKRRYSLVGVAPIVTPADVNALLRQDGRAWGASQAYALDVGQASFNIVLPRLRSAPALIFDAGQPIWFHLHNFPAGFAPPAAANVIVVLSHWDTDHYAYGRQNTSLHDKLWIAPAQTSVGPNAEAFARQLSNTGNLLLVGRGRSSRHRRGVRVIRCSGKSVNGSGLALHLKSVGRDILLTGDADYHEIPSMQGVRLSGLQIPHHGGRLDPDAVIPAALSTPARAIASCGVPNRYGHPNVATIAGHVTSGWNVSQTADAPGIPRGARRL